MSTLDVAIHAGVLAPMGVGMAHTVACGPPRARRAGALRGWGRATRMVAALAPLPVTMPERLFTRCLAVATRRADVEFILAAAFLYNATFGGEA